MRHICFVTGSRAEFGLMVPVLRAMRAQKGLRLSVVATGMHLSREHGYTVRAVEAEVGEVMKVPWKGAGQAQATGLAMAGLVDAFEKLQPDVVLVVGDRVEAFAGAAAGHLSGRVVAHVHGGDRALGQTDDAVRHAITKLAHVHFPATKQSAVRIRKLGDEGFRIFRAGSPGVDGIKQMAASREEMKREFGEMKKFALLVLHPEKSGVKEEERKARVVLDGVLGSSLEKVVIVYPNNDPGSGGILKVWEQLERAGIEEVVLRKDVKRELFLGLMRDAAVMVGNSSAGIIEAASFGTPVVDIGTRQQGRERSKNVAHVKYEASEIGNAIEKNWRKKSKYANVYGAGHAGRQIAKVLAEIELTEKLRNKLIAY